MLALTQSFGDFGYHIGVVLGERSSASNDIRYASRLGFADADISWYPLHTYLANVDFRWI